MSTTHDSSAALDAALERLHRHATDEELPVLDALLERSGLIWECAACRWRNLATEAACDQCQRPRAATGFAHPRRSHERTAAARPTPNRTTPGGRPT